MNTAELVEEVSENLGITKSLSKKVISFILNKIMDEVGNGREVKLTGFGTFYKLSTKDRRGYDIQKKEHITIPSRDVPRFRAGTVFKEKI